MEKLGKLLNRRYKNNGLSQEVQQRQEDPEKDN
jgi:hypothetical protein